MKTLAEIQGDPKFAALSREDQTQVLETVKPGFSKLSLDDQDGVIGQLTSSKPLQAGISKTVNPLQGIGNVIGSAVKGVGDAVSGAFNPQTYANLAGQIGGALSTEMASRQAEAAGTLPDPMHYGRPQALDLLGSGLRNIANGVTSLPADIGNAYTGQNTFSPSINIPASPREQFLAQNYPASIMLGNQLPLGLPLGRLAGGARTLATIGEGAVLGGLQDSETGLQGRFGNAATGAALPAAAASISKLLRKQPVMPEPQPYKPGYLSPQMQPSRAIEISEGQFEGINAGRNFNRAVSEIGKRQGLDPKKTLNSRISAYDSLHQKLDRVINSEGAPEEVKSEAIKAQARIRQEYQQSTQSKQSQFGRTPKQEKANITDKDKLNDLVSFVQEMRSQGYTKEADVAIGKFSPETRAKVYDAVKKAEGQTKEKARIEKLKASEQAKSNKALESAEAQQRKREVNQLKGSIKESVQAQAQRSKADKDADTLLGAIKVATKSEPKKGTDVEYRAAGPDEYKRMAQEAKQQKPAPKPKKPPLKKEEKQDIIKTWNTALKKGQAVHIEYEAEVTGETSTYKNKTVTPSSPPITTQSGNILLRGANSDGQIRDYLLNDTVRGSRILSAKSTNIESPHIVDGAGKDARVIDRYSGEVIKRVEKQGVKSSVLREKVSTMEEILDRIKSGEAVSPDDILKTANSLDDKDLTKIYERSSPKQKKQSWEEKTGDNC